jgi:hypothetical protein
MAAVYFLFRRAGFYPRFSPIYGFPWAAFSGYDRGRGCGEFLSGAEPDVTIFRH